MQITAVVAVASVLLGIISACGAPVASTTGSDSGSPSPARSTSTSQAKTAQQICQDAFSDGEVLSWARGTVSQFRQYQFGGPTPTRPLAATFSDLPGKTPGAWCGVRVSAETTRWWAVVEGRDPVKAIDITGPGEGTMRGEAQGPPVVP
jgi:hypothetical protein